MRLTSAGRNVHRFGRFVAKRKLAFEPEPAVGERSDLTKPGDRFNFGAFVLE